MWEHDAHHEWDDAITPFDARRMADKIDAAAAQHAALASALRAAATEVDGWAGR